MGQIKQAFAKMGSGIKEDFYKLAHEFTVRSFFTILFGVVLFSCNAYLFVASAIKMFAADGGVGWIHFAGGLFGFLISCFLIFIITVHFSVSQQEGAVYTKEGTIFSGNSKGKRIASILLVILIAFGGGGAALGVYIANEKKYDSYPQTTATVVSIYNNGNDEGYTAVYEYTVDGTTYRTKGKLKGKGEAVPRIGDTVTIKYNPRNPNDIHISTESKFFLGFGCFLIFFGAVVIAFWLYDAKKLKTQFFIAFILLGLTACIFICFLASTEFHGFIPFFARNFMLHFVLIFTNLGFLELVNGIVYIGHKNSINPE